MKRHNSSDVNESLSSTSVKDILRCKIAQKQAQQNKELASKAQDNSTLTYLASTLSSADFFCEVRLIVYSDLFPLPTVPSSALIIEQSRNLQFPQVPVRFSLLDL